MVGLHKQSKYSTLSAVVGNCFFSPLFCATFHNFNVSVFGSRMKTQLLAISSEKKMHKMALIKTCTFDKNQAIFSNCDLENLKKAALKTIVLYVFRC